MLTANVGSCCTSEYIPRAWGRVVRQRKGRDEKAPREKLPLGTQAKESRRFRMTKKGGPRKSDTSLRGTNTQTCIGTHIHKCVGETNGIKLQTQPPEQPGWPR